MLLGTLLFFSCKDKEKDCTAVKYKVPCAVAFKGFAADDLDTLYLNLYVKGSGFGQFIKKDTVMLPGVDIINDTAFASTSRAAIISLSPSVDYEVEIPTLSRSFRVSDITYSNDTVVRWTAKDCNTQGSFPLPPTAATVNGISRPTIEITGTSRWIVLSN